MIDYLNKNSYDIYKINKKDPVFLWILFQNN